MSIADRFLLDSNVHDKLVDDPAVLEALAHLVSVRAIEVLSTHVQADEMAATANAMLIERLMSVPVKRVPTFGVVAGVSRFDEARLSGPEPFETLQGGNPGRSKDALIASTAQYEKATLVTEDKRLASRARKQGIAVLGWDGFRSSVLERDASSG